MTSRQKLMENKFEDLKVYINKTLINQNEKLKEYFSGAALRCWNKLKQTDIMKGVKIYKVKIEKAESDKASPQK